MNMKNKINTFLVITVLCMGACNQNDKKINTEKSVIDTIVKDKSKVVVTEDTTLPMPKDTGQQYFKVLVTKNSQPMAQYEGDFPIAMFDEANFSIQFPASSRMLKISHFLVLYFKGIMVGSFPVVISGHEKGKPTIIFTPEKDGAYGIGVSMITGNVNITKYSAAIVSGNLDAEGKDTDGNNIHVKASFINIKNNDLNK
jgi:hypothetical protein